MHRASFLETYSLSVSFLGLKTLYIVINFIDLCSISLSSSLVHLRNDPEYLRRGIGLMFIPLMKFLLQSLVSKGFVSLQVFSCFPLFQFHMAHFSMSNSIPISWFYILIVYIWDFLCFTDLAVQFLPLFFFSPFSLSSWHIFQYQIPFFLYQKPIIGWK